jgi:hypothetical protein
LGKPLLFRFEQFVHHRSASGKVEDRAREFVQCDGCVNQIPVSLPTSFHRAALNRDAAHIHAHAGDGQISDISGLNPLLVHKTGHFNAAVFGKIRNEPGVPDVSIDHPRGVCDNGVDDISSIFVAGLQWFFGKLFDVPALFLEIMVGADLIVVPPLRDPSSDLFRRLPEVGKVFASVMT